jgi:purine-binding chemotaxis protein CheW
MATNSAALKPDTTQLNGQYSTFYVDDLFFGVDVLDVQEVLRFQQMTPVPQAPDVIEGLINLRGQIVTAIDLRRQLQLPLREGDRTPMNVVVRTSDGAVSLLVDEIGDVLDVDAATYERPPENLNAAARELIRGVYKLKDQLLLVLDTEKASDVCTAQSNLSEAAPAMSWSAAAEAAELPAPPRAKSRKSISKNGSDSVKAN